MKRVMAILAVLLLLGVNTKAMDLSALRIKELESQVRFMESEIVQLEQDISEILTTN